MQAIIKKTISQMVRDLKIVANKKVFKVHGSKRQKISMLTNHFKVNVGSVEEYFFHYSVSISYEACHPVDGKGVGKKSD